MRETEDLSHLQCVLACSILDGSRELDPHRSKHLLDVIPNIQPEINVEFCHTFKEILLLSQQSGLAAWSATGLIRPTTAFRA